MTFGLLLTALGLGLRHGVDWDHIAAIADLSGTAENRRRGFLLSMIYAAGHAAVVFGLGVLAIAFGLAIPDGVDAWMGRIVGITLIALGLWILIELVRKGRDFRLRSRWMLIIDGTFAGLRKVRNRATQRFVSVEHEHEHEHSTIDLTDETADREADAHTAQHAHDHSHVKAHAHAFVEEHVEADAVVPAGGSGGTDAGATTSGWRAMRQRSIHRHAHTHRHDLVLPGDPDARYGNRTAAGIGMLHGVGIESPTQIAIFVASTSVAGLGFGIMILTAWVAGLMVANAVLAAMAGAGVLNAERSFPVYATLAVIVSLLSIALGTLYLAGFDILPEIIAT